MASGYSDLSEIRKGSNSANNISNAYGLYQKPPKINLLNEQPRRESVVEQQLASTLTRANTNYYTNPQVTPIGSQHQQRQQQQQQQQQQQLQQQVYSPARSQVGAATSSGQPRWTDYHYQQHQKPGGLTSSTATTTTTTTRLAQSGYSKLPATTMADYYAELESDLAQKEARLKREIAYLNQQLSPWARPRQIREPRREPEPKQARSDQRWVKECPRSAAASPRPGSRASSARSNTGADLMDKASKLLQDAEELEKKPLKTQSLLIEDGARSMATRNGDHTAAASGIQTAVIMVPSHEPDNKSPLPVAFDNFSTLGVRGNIASIGAAPPDTPYAPIFPVVKRTPSPMPRR